ncbi:caspase family protein [Streptomyces sp. NPDC050982]|uniref:effector-associated domain 2-containing protein n=1 Tax=Streptomyces sp. NPDC050982 TaxID=3154746 RepID=UPI0034022553
MTGHDPARVQALIVGIEAYDAGPDWDLPGPARDAVRFRDLLHAAGVPGSQLRLHLSPLTSFVPDVEYSPADHATLRRTLVHELPRARGDVLWVWWGGHGVLDRSGRTRLFCADATTTDKVAVDLESALDRYTSDSVPGFAEQLWIVDACETFEEALAFRDPLPPNALPSGHRTLAHRQTLLRAAGRGRPAANDPVRATGLFSDALLEFLADRAASLPAHPDPEELFSAVRGRIAALRKAGRTAQHPEIRLRSPQRTEILPATAAASGERPLSPLGRVVDALLAYPLMADPVERQMVVGTLNPRVTGTMSRHARARTDAIGILTALSRCHPKGLWELYDAVVSVDDDPERKTELAHAIREFSASVGGPHGLE